MKKILILTMSLMIYGISPISAEPLTITLDFYPPFEYMEKGEIKGMGSEVVKAVLKKADMKANFEQYPFKRAYKMVTKDEQPVFYYSLVRTPERENLVKWVGIVAHADQTLLALKNRDIRIEKLQDIKNYNIATISEDVMDQYLGKRETELGLKLERIPTYDMCPKMFIKGRFDLWAVNKFVACHLMEMQGYSKNDIKVVYTFEDLKSDYYLVGNQHVPADIVRKLQAVFEKIHTDGTYQKIINGYFDNKYSDPFTSSSQ